MIFSFLHCIISVVRENNFTNTENAKSNNNIFCDLKEANNLLDAGVISNKEYEDIKAKLISNL